MEVVLGHLEPGRRPRGPAFQLVHLWVFEGESHVLPPRQRLVVTRGERQDRTIDRAPRRQELQGGHPEDVQLASAVVLLGDLVGQVGVRDGSVDQPVHAGVGIGLANELGIHLVLLVVPKPAERGVVGLERDVTGFSVREGQRDQCLAVALRRFPERSATLGAVDLEAEDPPLQGEHALIAQVDEPDRRLPRPRAPRIDPHADAREITRSVGRSIVGHCAVPP